MRHTRCIVSLTYDDALPAHFESTAPFLEEHGFRGTFYVPCTPRFFHQMECWREVAAQGHELGNHALFHPRHGAACDDPAYDPGNYTARRWRDEVRLANDILTLVDGRVSRSFGNTCPRNTVGSGASAASIETLAPEFFVAARGAPTGRPVDLDDINWFNLGGRSADGATFEELRNQITRMSRVGGWLILSMHGVGPRDHKLHIAEDEHARLIEWLADRQETIWTAPVRAVADALKPASPHRASAVARA